MYRSHDVCKGSHDMAWYVWMQKETEILSIRRDEQKNPCYIRLECSCVSRRPGRNVGPPEAVANITLHITEKSEIEGCNGEKKTFAKAVSVRRRRVQLSQWGIRPVKIRNKHGNASWNEKGKTHAVA